MSRFLDIIKHLLPRARAWSLTATKKLRALIEGVAPAGDEVKDYTDRAWQDIFPQTTRELDEWETQFAIFNRSSLTTQARRDRLDAAWKAVGGQSPKYIQDTLRGAGFDVYVHDWWEPGTEPAVGVKACATPRNPLLVLRAESGAPLKSVDCGEPLALCGEDFAESGNSLNLIGYPLVNKVLTSEPDLFTLCGEAIMECGEATALAGNYTVFREVQKTYIVPSDPLKWPYFWYVGGPAFGDIAEVPVGRREELEALILKIRPLHTWIGVIVRYN